MKMPEANSPLISFLTIAAGLPEAEKKTFKCPHRKLTGVPILFEKNLTLNVEGNNPWTDFIGKQADKLHASTV